MNLVIKQSGRILKQMENKKIIKDIQTPNLYYTILKYYTFALINYICIITSALINYICIKILLHTNFITSALIN